MVADNLARNLPDFKVHKIMIEPNEWEVKFNLKKF